MSPQQSQIMENKVKQKESDISLPCRGGVCGKGDGGEEMREEGRWKMEEMGGGRNDERTWEE